MQKFIRNLALAAVAVVGAISCSDSGIDENITPSEGLTLEATTPSGNPSTKVEFADEGDKGIALEWEAGDEFKLYQGEALIDTFVTTNGDGKFTSVNPNLTLTEDETYTAKFNGEATTAEQNGDDINNLNAACALEGSFTYGTGKPIAFEHKMAIMTFQFESDERPAYLIFQNGDESYKVTYSELNPDDNGIYTSHIMIKPYEATERTLSFTLYDSEGRAYDTRSIQSSKAYAAGMRYTSPVSELTPSNNWIDYAATSFANGVVINSNIDEYEISTPEQLAYLAKLGTSRKMYLTAGKTFTLTQNIDLTGKEWTPIGSNENAFYGIFDGGGYTIEGLQINTSDVDFQALFGKVQVNNNGVAAVIKNIRVKGSVTVSNGKYIAGIVGYAYSYTDNVYIYITNCYNEVSVSGTGYMGGVIASGSNCIITNCYNSGSITEDSDSTYNFIYAGGIASMIRNSTIANCYNIGTISCDNKNTIITAGIAGKINCTHAANCYNANNIITITRDKKDVSTYICGSIIGYSHDNSKNTNCYWDKGIEGALEVGIGYDDNPKDSKNIANMTTADMQRARFVNILNNNAYLYNNPASGEKPTVNACAWMLNSDGYPVHDSSNTEPQFSQLEDVPGGVVFE